jgi:Tol biopolymer transport system component
MRLIPALMIALAARLACAAVPLDEAAADRYAGYYLPGPNRAVRFWREDSHFFFNTVGTEQRAEVTPEAANRFSYANGNVTFSFNAGADGTITGVTVNQAGREIIAPRIDESTAMSFSAPGAGSANRTPVSRSWPVMSGPAPKVLTTPTSGTMDYWPCFSPDGSTVLFSRTQDGGKTWKLLRVDAAGGAAEDFVTLPVSATRASWSARTGRIAFNGDALNGNGGGIWVMDGDGRNAHAVATTGLIAPMYPSWYPDGATIAVGDAARNILYRVEVAGGTPVAVTRQSEVLAGMSSVSPDGRWIAFAGQKNEGHAYNQADNLVWIADGTGDSTPLEPQSLQGRAPVWSPDGRRLAFESDRGSPNGFYAVFIINRDGTGLVQVTDYALNANHPVFSPDGRQLVFAIGDGSDGGTGIAIMTLPDQR